MKQLIKYTTIVLLLLFVMHSSYESGKSFQRVSIINRYDVMHPSKTEVEGYAKFYVFDGDSINIYMGKTGNYPKGINGYHLQPYFEMYRDRLYKREAGLKTKPQ